MPARRAVDPASPRGSPGGLSSDDHSDGRPLAFTLTGGNTNDRCAHFTAATEAIRVPRIGP
ncbi:hypothetical protein D9753_32085 [Streptomyces dangxiongensis]|uniref:Uncharacterized protein n=1 Tax=Streptomyces dangxiongensis TaxID=1442032 RepID=A0A3G2JK79_9ACTN|nr:hypothetical protein [Streptomyces dangxiongensis]AYN42744.1 hypothetical protein D9753_32085 [Streptomyces dangxiongensis]